MASTHGAGGAVAAWCAIQNPLQPGPDTGEATSGLNWLLSNIQNGNEALPNLIRSELGPFLTSPDQVLSATQSNLKRSLSR